MQRSGVRIPLPRLPPLRWGLFFMIESLIVDLTFPLRSAFLALPLEGLPKWQFQGLQQELEPFKDCLRFQNPQSPHLTLYFWKELLKIEFDPIVEQSRKIAARSQSFTIQVNGVDTFGKAGFEKVLFLTVAFSPELATLKKLCPWPNPPDQPFQPHITVARIGHPQKFTVRKKQIMKVFHGLKMDVPVNLMRLYAEVNGRKQTPLEDFGFTS